MDNVEAATRRPYHVRMGLDQRWHLMDLISLPTTVREAMGGTVKKFGGRSDAEVVEYVARMEG